MASTMTERQLQIDVRQQQDVDELVNEWLRLQPTIPHQMPFVVPLTLKLTNNRHERRERIASTSVKIWRRHRGRRVNIADVHIVDLYNQPIANIWIEPLQDCEVVCFIRGTINAQIAYNLFLNQPAVIEIALHRVGGIVRTLRKRLPWDWIFVPGHLYEGR